MAKELTAYGCGKCDFYAIGKDAKSEVIEHERLPENGRMPELDGLVVRLGVQEGLRGFVVFTESGKLNMNHRILYSWRVYDDKTLERRALADYEEHKRGHLEDLFPDSRDGLTCERVIHDILLRQRDDFPPVPKYLPLDKKELAMVAKELPKKYPEYKKTNFKTRE